MNKYTIKPGPVGSDHVWNIVNEDGTVIASLHGASSGVIAVAACEAMNAGFQYDGWTERLQDLMK